jgi:hypothetical protein
MCSMKADSSQRRFAAMRVPKEQSSRTAWPKQQKRRDRLPATVNKRLAEQIRNILGKHYASKYRVR